MANFTDTWSSALENYRQLLSKSDPRFRSILSSTPWPCLAVTVFYLIFVLKLGPALMKNRKPLNIQSLLVVYNFSMVFLSGYLFWEMGVAGWLTYSWSCEPIDYSWSPKNLRMAKAFFLYWISKHLELLDTVFFIFRKKFSHVTVLHVFHHTAMPISNWIATLYSPVVGFCTFHCWVNCFVHVVMYFYYGLAALGPSFQKYLWWKKELTQLQIIQFVIGLSHSSQIFWLDCDIATEVVYATIIYNFIFMYLFGSFYYHTYINPTNDKKIK